MHASHPADAAPPLLFAGPHLHGRSDSLTQDRRYSRRTSPVHVSNPRGFLMHVADHAELLAILNSFLFLSSLFLKSYCTFASASVLGVRSGRFGVGAFGERERCSTAAGGSFRIPRLAFGRWTYGGLACPDYATQSQSLIAYVRPLRSLLRVGGVDEVDVFKLLC